MLPPVPGGMHLRDAGERSLDVLAAPAAGSAGGIVQREVVHVLQHPRLLAARLEGAERGGRMGLDPRIAAEIEGDLARCGAGEAGRA